MCLVPNNYAVHVKKDCPPEGANPPGELKIPGVIGILVW